MTLIALLVILAIHAAAISVYVSQARGFPTSRTAEKRIEWMVQNCGPRARIGLMNAGKIGYLAGFRSELTIVNLDGVVNNPVFEAYRSGRFLEYFCKNVDCAIELPSADVFSDPHLRTSYEAFLKTHVVETTVPPARIYRFQCGPR